MNKQNCDEWKNHPTQNPLTGKRIKEHGPTYKKIEKDCNTLDNQSSLSLCAKWRQNKLINPRTNRQITVNGPIYKKLAAECANSDYDDVKDTQCAKWKDDFTIDPVYNRAIMVGCSEFDQISKKCNTSFDQLNIPTLSSFMKSRVLHEQTVVKLIKNTKVSQWDMCMSSGHSKFRDSLSDVTMIGWGTFGEVYKATINGVKFVVKEAYLSDIENTNLIKHRVGRNKEGVLDKNTYPQEFVLLSLVKELIKTNKCPNFLYAYNVSICDECKLTDQSFGTCYLTFMEPGDGNLQRYLTCNNLSDAEIWSIIYQCLIAVHVMHTTYGIVHKDIKPDNFLIKFVKPGGCIEYKVHNNIYSETFHVENHGIMVLLSDLGVSESVHPAYTMDEFTGMRNAVAVSIGSSVVFQPITCDYVASDGGTIIKLASFYPMITWANGAKSTYNRTYNNVPIELLQADVDIDVYDFIKFPAFEFRYDVLDVINMFVGEKRMLNTGTHSSIKTIPSSVVHELKRVSKNSNIFNYDQKNTHSVIAALMLKKLYKRFTDESKLNIIASFQI